MPSHLRRLRPIAVAAAVVCAAGSAVAQDEAYRPTSPPPPKVTSSIQATTPTAAETREVKALTTAVFAKPAAAARAVEKATANSQPDYAVDIPKPESPLPDGLRPGGKGVEIKTPF